jgi:beta-N-acetylhexosaminidase
LDQNELAVFRHFSGRDISPQPSHSSDDSESRPDLYRVDSMMICHGWYPAFEPRKMPASLSQRIITKLLRDEFGFDGLIMTDDLDMGAILNEYDLDETIELALAAGNDMAMICHRVAAIDKVHATLRRLPHSQIDRALESVDAFKSNLVKPDQFSEETFRKINDEIWDLRVAVLGEERAKVLSVEDAARSPVELY